MDNLVTIKTFNYPHEAAVVKGRLEAEGITCFLKDAVVTQVNPLYSNAVGGVKLQIEESDVERATAILAEAGYSPDIDKYPEEIYNGFEKLRVVFSNKLVKKVLTLVILISVLIYFYITIF